MDPEGAAERAKAEKEAEEAAAKEAETTLFEREGNPAIIAPIAGGGEPMIRPSAGGPPSGAIPASVSVVGRPAHSPRSRRVSHRLAASDPGGPPTGSQPPILARSRRSPVAATRRLRRPTRAAPPPAASRLPSAAVPRAGPEYPGRDLISTTTVATP